MLTRESFRLGFLGLLSVLIFVCSIILGLLFGSITGKNFALDLTRTEICCGNPTTEALIRATQTSAVIQTQLAKIQPTQTYIANTKATLEAQIQPTLDE